MKKIFLFLLFCYFEIGKKNYRKKMLEKKLQQKIQKIISLKNYALKTLFSCLLTIEKVRMKEKFGIIFEKCFHLKILIYPKIFKGFADFPRRWSRFSEFSFPNRAWKSKFMRRALENTLWFR